MLKGSSSHYLWGLLALTLGAYILRIYGLDAQSLWVDEAISLNRSQQPLSDLLRNMPAEHAPLYFTLLHFWLPLTGTTDLALRFPSLFFGALCVPLIGQLGTTLFDRWVGLLVALLLAVNPFHIWYAQDARMYTMVTAFSLACLVSLVRALQTNQWRHWAVYAASGALALYSHYYAGLILVASGTFALGWLACSPTDRRREGRRWLASVTAMGLLFLPWLPQALRVFGFHGFKPPIEAETVFRRYITVFSLGTSVPDDLGWRLTWGFLALAGVGLVALGVWARRNPNHRPGAGMMLTLILVSALGGILLAMRVSHFFERYFIVVTPAYYLAIALGLRALAWPRRAPVGAAAALAFVLVASLFSLRNHYTDPQFAKPNYKQVTADIARWADPKRDALVLSGALESAIRRYYPGERPKIYNLKGSRYRDLDEAGQIALFGEIAQKYRQIWLLRRSGEADLAYTWFSQQTFPVAAGWTTDIFVARFVMPTPSSPPLVSPGSVRADGPVTLQGYTFVSRDVAPGQVLPVILGWATHTSLEHDYKVSLRLVDPAGGVTAAVDRRPANGFAPSSEWPVEETVIDRHGLWVPPETTPGLYQVVIKLYDPADLRELVSAQLGAVTVTEDGGAMP